jgi:hypothetical protein
VRGMARSKAADKSVRATRSLSSDLFSKSADSCVLATLLEINRAERIPCRAVGLSKSIGVLHCAARFRAALFRMTKWGAGGAVSVVPRAVRATEASRAWDG